MFKKVVLFLVLLFAEISLAYTQTLSSASQKSLIVHAYSDWCDANKGFERERLEYLSNYDVDTNAYEVYAKKLDELVHRTIDNLGLEADYLVCTYDYWEGVYMVAMYQMLPEGRTYKYVLVDYTIYRKKTVLKHPQP